MEYMDRAIDVFEPAVIDEKDVHRATQPVSSCGADLVSGTVRSENSSRRVSSPAPHFVTCYTFLASIEIARRDEFLASVPPLRGIVFRGWPERRSVGTGRNVKCFTPSRRAAERHRV